VKVSEIGEFGLIDALAGLVSAEPKAGKAWQDLVIGIGDDAAAWRSDSSLCLATVDALVQDVHFKLDMTSWEDLGWKSLAVNLSDIAAMGGSPRYALVSLSLPQDTEVEDALSFYRGMLSLARRFEVVIAGGNISSAPIVTINVTVFGKGDGVPERLLTRSSARAGDRVAVTGHLGSASAGLEMLTKGQSRAASSSALRQAFLRPCPRVAEARILVEQGVRTAIDISDGLVSDLGHVCSASRLGARIRVGSVPVSPEVRESFGTRATGLALSGGEDYELLFTAPPPVMEAAMAALRSSGCPVTIIGETVQDQGSRVILLDDKGNEITAPKLGWDHFAAGKHGG
jgi:thiamine-monophosphate kinase